MIKETTNSSIQQENKALKTHNLVSVASKQEIRSIEKFRTYSLLEEALDHTTHAKEKRKIQSDV